MNQELLEKHHHNQIATMKNTGDAARPNYCLKVKYPLCFFVSYRYTAVQIKVDTMKNVTISIMQRRPSCATTKSTPFAVSKGE